MDHAWLLANNEAIIGPDPVRRDGLLRFRERHASHADHADSTASSSSFTSAFQPSEVERRSGH
jgi:hypothetical protein